MSDSIFSQNFEWWDTDKNKSLVALHSFNKSRLQYILNYFNKMQLQTTNMKFLDYGCGGGLLCEPLSKLGFDITGYDLDVEAAKNHSNINSFNIKYINNFENLIDNDIRYDVIFCLEMLEHVKDYSLEIQKISQLLKTNGLIFFSTINKNLKSFVLMKIIAENILNLVPKNIHSFDMFIKPSDLISVCKNCNLELIDLSGMSYNPITTKSCITKNTDVNYISIFQKK